MNEDKNKQLLFSLIYSFQMQAMMQLGKLTNPVSNKTEKELDGAQITIDMLDMLKAKTKNNVGDDETRFLDQVIADLKLNYVEERDKEKSSEVKGGDKSSSETDNEKATDSGKTDSKKSSTSGKEKPVQPEKEAEEKPTASDGDEKKKSSQSESKEKPLPEQIKEDEENPVPPQE